MIKAILILVLGYLLIACSDGSDNELAVPQNFSSRGPYAVGVTQLQLDTGASVLVFYPVDRHTVSADAVQYEYTPEEIWGPLAAAFPPGSLQTTTVDDAWRAAPLSDDGPFPLVLHSHSRGGNYHFASRHNAHTASWGFIVAAPAHSSRDLLVTLGGSQGGPTTSDEQTVFDTMSLLSVENGRSGGPLEGGVDLEQIIVEGHSAGGRTAGVAAYDPRVDGWIGLAPSAPVPDEATQGRDIPIDGNDGFDPSLGEFDLDAYLAGAWPPDKPSLFLTDDEIAANLRDAERIWDWLPPPKRYVVLADTGWNVYTDYCELAQERGGVQAVIDAFNLQGQALRDVRYGEMGCLPKYAPVGDVTDVWNHLTVAFLNQVFEIDPEVATVSLDPDYLDATFPDRIADMAIE
jgi:Platelet-activating factor acetylhydrolase, isoform II